MSTKQEPQLKTKTYLLKITFDFPMSKLKKYKHVVENMFMSYMIIKIECTFEDLLDLKKEKGFETYVPDFRFWN